MSKRKSQTAVADYIAQGFIREALVNYLALLGWSTGTEEEILSLDEIAERFDLENVQKGGAVFDRERLEWLNGQWIRRLTDDDLVDRLLPFLEAEHVAGRIDRMPDGRRGPGAAADRPRATADPRCDRRPGRLPVDRRAQRRPGATRARSAGTPATTLDGLTAARDA